MSLTTSGPFPIIPIDPPQTNFATPEIRSQAAECSSASLLTLEESECIHEDFYQQYLHSTSQENRDRIVAAIRDYSAFDPNYSEGIFFICAAKQGDIDFLLLLITQSKQNTDLTENLHTALANTAYCGYAKCVISLLNYGADPIKIIGSSAYTHHAHIKDILDNHINRMHKVES